MKGYGPKKVPLDLTCRRASVHLTRSIKRIFAKIATYDKHKWLEKYGHYLNANNIAK